MSDKTSIAEDLSRSYHYVRRFVGARLDVDGETWILSRPTHPDDKVGELAHELCLGMPKLPRLAELVGAREVLRVNAGALGKGWYHLTRLERNDALRELIDEGVRPLRSLRKYDLAARLAELRDALERAQLPSGSGDLTTLRGRLVGVYGEVGGEIHARWVQAQQSEDRRLMSLQRLVEAAELVDRGEGAGDPLVREMWLRIDALERREPQRSRALVALFRDVVGGNDPQALGRRRTQEASARGLDFGPAVRRLIALYGGADEVKQSWSDAQRKVLLELAIRFRATKLELPRAPDKIRQLRDVAVHLGNARLGGVWPALLGVHGDRLSAMMHVIARSQLSGNVLGRALRADVIDALDEFEDDGRATAYLDAVDRLHENPVPHVDPKADWFVRPFRAGRAWEPGLALALLTAHRDDPQSLVTTFDAARTTGFAEFGFADAIASWSKPTLAKKPAYFDALRELLGMDEALLERYVHWRSLVTGEADFSASLRGPLELKRKEARELEHLLSLPSPSPALSARIGALQSTEQQAARLEDAVRQAKRSFDRSLEQLERESLDAVIQQTARAAFARLLGRTVTGKLPKRVRALILLLGAEGIDLDEVRYLIDDLLAERDLNERRENRQWLERMKGAGFDMDRWLAGVDFEVEAAGQTLRFRTEFDPLHVLEMGSYFNTCLALEDGFNAASTLTNAVDANKQVIYGYRPDGAVVARKLFAVTDDGGMLGYRMYAFDERRSVAAAVDDELVKFAVQCGLRPVASGTPTPLHRTFWYDDGVEAWCSSELGVDLPEDAPSDQGAAEEWAYIRGFEDPAAWRWAAANNATEWGIICGARYVMGRDDLSSLPDGVLEDEVARGYLVARGDVRWFGEADTPLSHIINDIVFALPDDVETLRRYAETVRSTKGPKAQWASHLSLAPTVLARLPVAELAAHLVDHIRIIRDANPVCFDEPDDTCAQLLVTRSADMLTAAWLRDGPGDVDRLFTARDELTERIGCALATRVQDANLARRVRHRFKRTGCDGLTELALAAQGDDSSRWALEGALRGGAEIGTLLDVDFDEEPNFDEWPVDFQPRGVDAVRLHRALFRHEPSDAVLKYVFGSTTQMVRGATLPFWADAELLARAHRVWTSFADYYARWMRAMIGSIPDREARFARLAECSTYTLREVLGVEPNDVRDFCLWSADRDLMRGLEVLNWSASELEPQDFDEILTGFVERHGSAILGRADAMARVLRSEHWSVPSYRIPERLGQWLQKHPQGLHDLQVESERAAWFVQRFVSSIANSSTSE